MSGRVGEFMVKASCVQGKRGGIDGSAIHSVCNRSQLPSFTSMRRSFVEEVTSQIVYF